jgi:hypothetical protein
MTVGGFRYEKRYYKNLQEVVRDLTSVLTVPLSRVCLPVPAVAIRSSQYGAMPSMYSSPLHVHQQT